MQVTDEMVELAREAYSTYGHDGDLRTLAPPAEVVKAMLTAALPDKQAGEVSRIACEGRPSVGNNPCAVCGRSALVDVPAGVRWRVFEDTTHGWWGIEIDGDEDGEPILYPIKTDRASLDKIADAYNATSTSKLIEERDKARRQAEDQWAGWVKSDCRVRALEAAVRIAIKGIEGADPEVLTDTLWMPEAILKGATVVDVLQGALSECLQARRTSPHLSREGEDSAEVGRALAFVARWAWREHPSNAVRKLTDAERLSAIKHHPTIKALAATRSGSATTAKGGSDA